MDTQGNTGAVLHAGAGALNAALADGSDARREAEILLCAVSGRTRASLYAWPEREISATEQTRFDALVARRAAGEPVAYLLGRAGFMDFELDVCADVLVPRPETELLVEATLAQSRSDPCALRIADLGTGSGAIAIALARAGHSLLATDASAAALAVARRNAQSLGVGNIDFQLGSWCAGLGDARFDVVVSNPPYVAESDPYLDALAFEPRAALVAAKDGTADLARIADDGRAHLVAGGWLLLEHGFQQGAWLRTELERLGYTGVSTMRDYAGHERVTKACWAGPP